MTHELPRLPYEKDYLSPYMSSETLEYHHGKHVQTYINNLNRLIIGTEYENMSLEEIVKQSKEGPIYNNAAQVWNHTFFFSCLTGNSGKKPSEKIMKLIDRDFGSFEGFKEKFTQIALSNFGSGWTWLDLNNNGFLEITNTSNAQSMFGEEKKKPLLVCDVWEHAYYIDTRNDRAKYLENFWNIIHWDFVDANLNLDT